MQIDQSTGEESTELSDIERSVNSDFTKSFKGALTKLLGDPAYENIQTQEARSSGAQEVQSSALAPGLSKLQKIDSGS